jgi:predicted nucleic acid-binding protein
MSGVVLAERVSQGRPTPTLDAQIAGTALVFGVALATRNGADFDGLGIELIDPWRDA